MWHRDKLVLSNIVCFVVDGATASVRFVAAAWDGLTWLVL
jgi:hypothetical protein